MQSPSGRWHRSSRRHGTSRSRSDFFSQCPLMMSPSHPPFYLSSVFYSTISNSSTCQHLSPAARHARSSTSIPFPPVTPLAFPPSVMHLGHFPSQCNICCRTSVVTRYNRGRDPVPVTGRRLRIHNGIPSIPSLQRLILAALSTTRSPGRR